MGTWNDLVKSLGDEAMRTLEDFEREPDGYGWAKGYRQAANRHAYQAVGTVFAEIERRDPELLKRVFDVLSTKE